MQGSGKKLLACSRLTTENEGYVGRSVLLHQSQNPPHLSNFADDPVPLGDFLNCCSLTKQGNDCLQQLFRLEWLLDNCLLT